jgi:hypothetical protein
MEFTLLMKTSGISFPTPASPFFPAGFFDASVPFSGRETAPLL